MIAFYKNVGETPLEALDRLRLERPELAEERLSYAGRLDPMAEGLLLVLVGGENKERERYLGLDKEYEAEILLGIETDTYDILGIAASREQKAAPKKIEWEEIASYLAGSIGEREMEYPPFSSKTVDGVPLFSLMRKGINVVLPKKKVAVREAELLDLYHMKREDLGAFVRGRIAKVKGDFRQEDILAAWKEASGTFPASFAVARVRLEVGSGFYVRSFAHDMGKAFGTGAIALSIRRTRIGDHSISDIGN